MFAPMSVTVLSLWLLLAPPSPPPSPPATAEPSVRPGANQQYVDRDLSVWQQRFESAGREIFDQRAAILAATGLRPGMRVADVGAGTGLFTFAFAGAVGPGGRVYAVDIIPKFIDHLKAEARRRRARNVVPVLSRPDSVSLAPASVDVIFLCDTYHHFEFPRSMNRSLFRALRPGGTLVLIDFVRDPARTQKATLEHVRAGQPEVTAELVAAGFVPTAEPAPVPGLKENYFVRFTRPAS
jgi:predicted methyltransferase